MDHVCSWSSLQFGLIQPNWSSQASPTATGVNGVRRCGSAGLVRPQIFGLSILRHYLTGQDIALFRSSRWMWRGLKLRYSRETMNPGSSGLMQLSLNSMMRSALGFFIERLPLYLLNCLVAAN